MNFLRQIVSGPKKRFVEDGYNLDLTYVCPRLIAMSFPASGLETLYRNNIDNVSKMIKNKHGSDYLIINLSGRKYDYSKFQDKVLDYEWEDHHSPPINTLFIICEKIHQFLKKKKENVAIIHCLAGKGRTGTIICCYMIYSGRFETPQEALLYYGKKRFLQEGLGVNQPCQIRYVYYFHQILTERNVYPTLKYIKCVEMFTRPKISDDGCRPFVELINVHSQQKIFSTQKGHSEQAKFVDGDYFKIEFDQSQPISGDILLRVKNNGAIQNKNMLRVSFNTAFIKPDNLLEFGLSELSPSQIFKDERFSKQFFIKIIFGDYCKCNCYTPFDKKCAGCKLELDKEKDSWSTIYNIIAHYQKPSAEEQTDLLFGKEPEDVDEILQKEKKTFVEAKGILQSGKSSEENSQRLSNFNCYLLQQSEHQSQEAAQNNSSSGDEGYTIIRGQDDIQYNRQRQSDNPDYIKEELKMQGIDNRKRSDVQYNIYDNDLVPSHYAINNSQNTNNINSYPTDLNSLKNDDIFNENNYYLQNRIQTTDKYAEFKNQEAIEHQNLINQIQKQGQDIQLFDHDEEIPSHSKNLKNKNI
ncbi:hypothetical protein ABPG72_011194 [Tetrahymena utriculariae]